MLAPFQIRLVTSMVVFLLAAYPNVVRLPSGARISSASLRICPPTIYDKVGPVTVCQTAHALRQPFLRKVDHLGKAPFSGFCRLCVTGGRRHRVLRSERSGQLCRSVTHRAANRRSKDCFTSLESGRL